MHQAEQTIPVFCPDCRQVFWIPAMYGGSMRPCPDCGKEHKVSASHQQARTELLTKLAGLGMEVETVRADEQVAAQQSQIDAHETSEQAIRARIEAMRESEAEMNGLREQSAKLLEKIQAIRNSEVTPKLGELGVLLFAAATSEAPVAQELTALEGVLAVAPDTPVVVHTGEDDLALAAHLVRHGAEDVLVKGAPGRGSLARALVLAVARRRRLQGAEDR